MPNPLDELFKVSESVGTMITAGWGLVANIRKRFGQLQDIKDRLGQQGVLFFLTYTIFQYLYCLALILWGLLGLAVLVGGIAKIVNPPVGLPYVTPLFDNYALQILAIAILLFLVAALNVLSWIPISVVGWIPAKWLPLKQSASWYNLLQFSIPLEQPKPLFISTLGISRLANSAIERLVTPSAGAADFAEKPDGLNADERANAALIGCLLEREHRVLKWGYRKWQPFYAAVAAAASGGTSMFSPEYLNRIASQTDFYGHLREEVNSRLPEGEPELPNAPEARNDVQNAVALLTTKFKGSAKYLPYRCWSRNPNLRVASKRAMGFRPLSKESMVPQFLKLAVRWDVWPNVKVGNFVYPYSSQLAMLLLEERALVTLPDAKSFAFRKDGELTAFRETMRRTVEEAKDVLQQSHREEDQTYIRELSLAQHPLEWELAIEVDFALWSLSREMAKENRFSEWKVNEGIIERKERTESGTTG